MAAPWFDDPNAFGAWSGALLGVLGGLLGILGGITGWLAPKGIGRRVILPLWWASCALGAGLAVFGVAALFSTQPYAIWYPFVLGGGMLVVLGGSLLPLVHRRYGEAAERRAAAAELRGGAVPSVRAPGRALPPLLLVEIRVRFNNWDRVRAERLPLLALNAALLGMGVVFLGVGTRRAVAPA